MKRLEVITELATLRGDAAILVGPGESSGALYHTEHRDPTIYNMDMGYAVPVCLGLALVAPAQRVVALEGDGSMVMGVGSIMTIGRYLPDNLVVLVIDNGVYGSTGYGDVQTPTGVGLRLVEVARAAGLSSDNVLEVEDVNSLRSALGSAMVDPGPWFIVARIDPVRRTEKLRPEHDLVETSLAFRREMMNRGYI